MPQYFLNLLIGYVSLFTVVWLHEVGHSTFYAIYGCKKNFLHVSVKPYIFFSTPSPVDLDKVQNLTRRENTIISYAGIGANILWTAISGVILLTGSCQNKYVILFLWMFLTLHCAEIVSYLFIGNIYLVSDMASIAYHYPNLRWINLILGAILTGCYAVILMYIPKNIFIFVLVWNVLTICAMCGGRIVFTIISNRKTKA